MICIGVGLYVLKIRPDFWTLGDRFFVWHKIILNWFDRPFTGYGFGGLMLKQYIIPIKESSINTALCEPIELLYDGGLFLIILIGGYLVTLMRRIIFALLDRNGMLLIGFVSGFCSYMIIVLGSNPLHIIPLALIGIVYIAGLEVQT